MFNCTNKIHYRNNIEEITVLNPNDSIPVNSKLISEIKIGYFPPYLSLYKDYDSILFKAKQKTVEMGGNALKIVSHTPYQYNLGNKEITLHKIKAEILQVDEVNQINKEVMANTNKAVLNFYMFYQGGFINENIYLDDVIIVKKMKSKSKKVYVTNKSGKVKLQMGEKGLPIEINISGGKSYYFKCHIKPNNFMGHTSFIELKDSITGKKEFNFF